MAVHPIFALILSGNLIEVAALIQSDPGAVTARNSDWYNVTPLHYSCHLNKHDITVIFLKHGADVNSKEVNSKDDIVWTPLHLACNGGHSEAIAGVECRPSL